MCSIVLRLGTAGVLIGANRDEMANRPWEPPAAYWPELPGVVAGRDSTAGGTWLGVNGHGVMAAVLNRSGTLGPLAGKRSRGELPLIALAQASAAAATQRIAELDAGQYRSFNLVITDAGAAFFIAGLEAGHPQPQALEAGTWMVTSGTPNDLAIPRIAKHLPKFRAAPASGWAALLSDNAAPSPINIPVGPKGFGTVCSSVIALPKNESPSWQFAAGPPHHVRFTSISLT